MYLAVGDRATVTAGQIAPTRVTTTSGHSIGAYLTWNGNRLGVAWCDDSEGNQELYFQSFAADGQATAPVTRVTTTSQSASIPAIKPAGAGFALLWNEHDPYTGDGHGGDLKSQVVVRLIP